MANQANRQSGERWSMGAVFETGLIIAGLLALLLCLPHGVYDDGAPRFNAISQLLQNGTLSNVKYSMIGPLFSIPFWLMGKLYRTSAWWCARYNWFLFCVALLAMYLVLRNRLDGRLIRTFFLLLIFASMFSFHLQFYYGEVFTALCVGVGLLMALIGPRLAGWTLVVLGVANTPATLAGLMLVVGKRLLDTRRLRSLLVVLAAAGLIVGESWLRRGSPTATRYESGFTNPFFFGVASILLSFGEGLVFFTPGLFLPVRRYILTLAEGVKAQLYSVYVLWAVFAAGLVLVYARWYDWSGAWFWGPRFFLFASIPASFALAVRLHNRGASLAANLLTMVVLCLSFWVGLDGAMMNTVALDKGFHGYSCAQIGNYTNPACFYDPAFSVLWNPFVVASELHWNMRAFLTVEQVGLKDIIYGILTLIALLYVAAPLARTVTAQIVTQLKIASLLHVRPAEWRV